MSIPVSDTGVNNAIFAAFDQERYSVIYSDGVIETLSSEQVTLANGGQDVIFTGLSRQNEINITVNVTAIKPTIKSKVKVLKKSEQLLIDKDQLWYFQ